MHERSVKITGGLWNSYELFKLETDSTIDRQSYCKICQEFNKRISQKIIKESFEFKIPFGLGYLRIKTNRRKIRIKDGKLQPHKMAPDWKATWTLWRRLYPDKTREEIKAIPDKKIVIHTNDHTDGYIMRWYWDKRLSNVKNQTVYMFKPVKGGITESDVYYGRLGLAKWILNPDRDNEYYK